MKMFIHIPKNSGMTVRHAAQTGPLKGKVQIATPNTHKSNEYSQAVRKQMKNFGDHEGYEHARWRDLAPNYQNMTCFAVIRNPWSRVVSRYFFAKQVIEIQKKVPANYADISSLEAFLEERHKWGNVEYMWHRAVRGWYPAMDHITDEKGNVKCDIMRTEHLNEDLCAYFNIPQMSRARNVTLGTVDYKEMYTPETIQIVADWYKRDIEYFDFDFDTPARRNYWNDKSQG